MRILHTSDWHLGASIEGFLSRDEDHRRFLEWLLGAVVDHAVDVLVVAGDVFDHGQPSADAQRLYYGFLARLAGTGLRKVVVVGGNHDSAARLDAPREVLEGLAVHVVGGVGADEAAWERAICPVPGRSGGVDAVVLAVPFVHEFWLGVRAVVDAGDVRGTLAARLADRYARLTDAAIARGDGAPVVATGHLACVGGERDDAPAEIHQIGTLGALPPSIFDPRLAYVALGHLHRSFAVAGSRARYSGSPIPLNVKESRSPRVVLLVDVEAGREAIVQPIEVPVARHVIEIVGGLDEVRAAVAGLAWSTPLPPIAHVAVVVDRHEALLEAEVQKAFAARPGGPLLARVVQRPRGVAAADAAEATAPSLAELSPEDVFLRLCRAKKVEADERLIAAFRAVLGAPVEGGRP
jgi:exonuclease SbcD